MAAIDDLDAWLTGYIEEGQRPILADLATARERIAALETEAGAFQSRINTLLAEADAAATTIAHLETKAASDGAEISALAARVTELLARIAELEAPPEPPTPSKVAGGLMSASLTTLSNVRKYGPDGAFTKIPWVSLEPAQGRYDWSSTDALLRDNPTTRFPLRIQAGGSTPDHLKALTGPVAIFNKARGIQVTTSKWWTEEAHAAWKAMITEAGKRYDGNPQVPYVSADLPMGVYSEPFILGGDPDTGKRLFAMGLTLDVHVASIKRCVDDTVAAFPNTLVELAIHGDLQYPDPVKGIGYSWEAGRQLALDLHAKHGKRIAFTDYGLGVGDTLAAHAPAPDETIYNTDDVYTFMHLLARDGFPVGFQLTPRGETTADNYRQMAQNAIDLGAWWCETSGWGNLGALATALDAALKANQYRLVA